MTSRRAATGRRAPRVGGALVGVPLQIPSCTQWLRSDLGITIGTGVSDWADQSGHSQGVSQVTATRQPAYTASDATINGHPSLLFDGTTDWLDSTVTMAELITASAGVIVAVAVQDVASAGAGVVCDVGGTNVRLTISQGSAVSTVANNDGALDSVTRPYTTLGVWRALMWIHGAGNISHRDNLGVSGTVASGDTSSLASIERVGLQSTALNGRIAEVIVYNRELTTAEQTLIIDYLRDRYGLA